MIYSTCGDMAVWMHGADCSWLFGKRCGGQTVVRCDPNPIRCPLPPVRIQMRWSNLSSAMVTEMGASPFNTVYPFVDTIVGVTESKAGRFTRTPSPTILPRQFKLFGPKSGERRKIGALRSNILEDATSAFLERREKAQQSGDDSRPTGPPPHT